MEKITDREFRGKRAARDGASGSLLLAHPAAMLRVEGAVMLVGSVLLYWMNGEVGGCSRCYCWCQMSQC